MQATETKNEGLKREFKVRVPADEIAEKVTHRLKELTRTINMPGFRPGKVPVDLLRKKYGPSVMGEVLEKTVNESSQKTMTEHGIRPAMRPEIKITAFDDGKDLEYTMAVEALPEIAPIDFAEIKLDRLVIKATDSEIDDTLQRLAEAHKSSAPVTEDRQTRNGDIAVIDFVGRVDGEVFPGGKADGYSLELGSDSFIPGFEEQLIGVKAGEQVTVSVTFPEEYGAEDLAGKEAVFSVDVKEVRAPVPAAVDDELARKAGAESLEELRKTITVEREQEYRAISRMRLKRQLLDALADLADFEVPAGMLDQEFESIWKQFEEARKAGEDMDPADAQRGDEEIKAEYRVIAERRVRLGLLLSEVGGTNNIQVGPDDLNRAVLDEARRHPGQEKEVFEHFQKDSEALKSLSGPVYEDKVVDFILELATVTDKEVSVEDLLKEPEEKPAAGPKKQAKPKTAKKKSEAKKTTAKKKAVKKKKD